MKRSLIACSALLAVAGSAFAAGPSAGATTDAQARYQAEVARCNSGMSQQDKATCLKEAGAALDEARRGRLDNNVAAAGFTGNATARCEVFTGEELSACKARSLGAAPVDAAAVGGATVTRGSVEGGGIIRESVQVYEVPAGTPGSTPVTTPMPVR